MFNCVKGSGTVGAEDRKITNFTKLNIAGDYTIILKQDSSLTLNISGDDNLLKYVRTDMDGDELKIDTKKNLCSKHGFTVKIGVRNINDIRASGAVDMSSDGKLNVKDISMSFSGACKVNMDMAANNVRTEGSGSTEVTLKGQAANHSVEFTGSGKLSALDFVVNKYTIHTTGASHSQINVLNELNVSSTGSSDIEYRGNPATINNNKTGASSIKKID